MQGLSRQDRKAVIHKLFVFCKCGAFQDHIAPVSLIAEKGMPDMLEMNPDLVGTAGLQLAVEQGYIAESFQDGVMCNGIPALAAIRKYGKNLTVADASPDIVR